MNDVVEGYWRNYRRSDQEDDTDWWAWEAVEDMVDEGDPGLVSLIGQLADAVAGDHAALAYLGAGPIETILRFRGLDRAAEFVGPIVELARVNENVWLALCGVWWDEEDQAAIIEHVRTVVPEDPFDADPIIGARIDRWFPDARKHPESDTPEAS